MDDLQRIVEELLAATGASRVTLRQDVPGELFPVTREALAPGVAPLRDVATPNMAGQPVVLEVTQGRQVVQDDCESAFPDDGPFHEMLALYGGMKAQIVTPVVSDGRVLAIVSLHELAGRRAWAEQEVELCRQAADRVRAALERR